MLRSSSQPPIRSCIRCYFKWISYSKGRWLARSGGDVGFGWTRSRTARSHLLAFQNPAEYLIRFPVTSTQSLFEVCVILWTVLSLYQDGQARHEAVICEEASRSVVCPQQGYINVLRPLHIWLGRGSRCPRDLSEKASLLQEETSTGMQSGTVIARDQEVDDILLSSHAN